MDSANFIILRTVLTSISECLLCRICFCVFEDEDVEAAILLAFLVFDLEVELFHQFFPVAVGEVAAAHQVVAPFDVLVVVELDDIGESLVHEHNLPAAFAHP